MEWWAHILWQRHGLSPREFCEMNERMRGFYIASELTAAEETKQGAAG